MINKYLSLVLLGSALLCGATQLHADAERCLDWEIQSYSSESEMSSCGYYNHDKVSTRFVVRNSCAASVNGVFSYMKGEVDNKTVMAVQAFVVDPGDQQEVANPCNMLDQFSYQISQVSH